MRIAVVDQTGKVYDHLKQAQSNESTQNTNENANVARGPQPRGFGNFVLEQAKFENQSANRFGLTSNSVWMPGKLKGT